MTVAAPFSTGRDPVGRWVRLGVAALACAAPWLWVVLIDDLSVGQQRFGAAVWAVVALFVVRRTVWSWTARLSVDTHGRLSQRNGPFGTQHVDLGRLRRVEGREEGAVLVRSTGGPITRVTPVLDVEDAHGARVRIAPGKWAHEDLVVAAVARAAAVARCSVAGGELFGLPNRGGVPTPGALDPAAVPARPIVLRMVHFRRVRYALFALVSVGVGALFLFIGASGADAMGSGFVNVTRIVALVTGVIALVVLVPGLRKRVTLDPGGQLAVSRPTFVPRLDLTTLAQVRVRVGPWTRVGLRRVEKATTLVLTDRSGRTAEIIDALWEDPRPLLLAVGAWVARTGAALDEDALRYLTTGTQPTAFGIGRSLW